MPGSWGGGLDRSLVGGGRVGCWTPVLKSKGEKRKEIGERSRQKRKERTNATAQEDKRQKQQFQDQNKRQVMQERVREDAGQNAVGRRRDQ